MYHQYNYVTRYFVKYKHFVYSRGKKEYLDVDIVPVYKLLDLSNKHKNHSLMIEQHKWRNIALIHVCERNLQELINYGAEIVNSEHLYYDEVDARIQVAFVCSKYLIEPSVVYETTNGLLLESDYKKLLKIFYNDYPEKYI